MTLAAIQMACGDDAEDNIVRAENFARQAAKENADVILLPELFERPYFCKTQRAEFLEWAKPASDNPMLGRMQNLARELKAAMPVSFFERAGSVYFNSLAMINADGNILGVYRKSHIPDGPGYQEKFYFSPGDSGLSSLASRRCKNRRGNLLGSMVSGGGAMPRFEGGGSCFLSDRNRQRAASS